MKNIEKKETDGTFEKITKKERLTLERAKAKLKTVLEGIEDMRQLPGALFVVDTKKEAIAVREAQILGIPVFAIVDTNCDPTPISFVVPGNDDASKSIQVITRTIAEAVVEANQHVVAMAKEVKEIDPERIKDETRQKYERDNKIERRKKEALAKEAGSVPEKAIDGGGTPGTDVQATENT
jgi:small subunit ribosomal protein S2